MAIYLNHPVTCNSHKSKDSPSLIRSSSLVHCPAPLLQHTCLPLVSSFEILLLKSSLIQLQFVQPSFLQQTPKQQLFLPSYSPLHTVPQTIDARCDKSAFHWPLTSQRSTEQINWFNSVSPVEFLSADAVLARYQCFKNMGDVGHLAIQLAKRTYFGTSVMSHSTVSGRNNTTPLDRKKMKEMKAVLRSVFSSISDEEFERVWMNCCTSISHAPA